MDYKPGKVGSTAQIKKQPTIQPESIQKPCCPDDPCLIMLRKAAIGERQAIAFYLEGAMVECRLSELFLDIAEDETQHFVETMRLISELDCVQANALKEEGLNFLVMRRAMIPKWTMNYPVDDAKFTLPDPEDMRAICLLTKAITDEFEAINQYQTSMLQSENIACREHFCQLMNDEKEHVAELTAALFKLTDEPLPEEMD